jgi:Ni,Fe-hydrogenase maturation factor
MCGLKVLVFGNPLVAQDSIALRLIGPLRKRFPQVEFREFDAAEDLEKEGRDLLILDSAIGIEEVALLDDLGAISTGRACSMHDFDLALTLKLLRKMGAIDRVRIIAVPSSMPLPEALRGASRLFSSLLSGNASRSSCTGRRP